MKIYLIIQYRDNTLLTVPQEEISSMNSLVSTLHSYTVVRNELMVAISEEQAEKQFKGKYGI